MARKHIGPNSVAIPSKLLTGSGISGGHTIARRMSSAKTTTIRVRGQRTPHVLLWLKGTIHRWRHIGGLAPDSGQLCSAYVTKQLCRFRNACDAFRGQIRAELSPLWAECDRLLQKLRSGPAAEPCDAPEFHTGEESNAYYRALEDAVNRRAKEREARSEDEKRLSDLYNLISTRLEVSFDCMEATRDLLNSSFAAYGQGLLREPVRPAYLPEYHLREHVELILQDRYDTWNEICRHMRKADRAIEPTTTDMEVQS